GSGPQEQSSVECQIAIRAGLTRSCHIRLKSKLMSARWIALTATAPLRNVIAPNSALNVPRMAAVYPDPSNAAPTQAITSSRVVPAPEMENHGREQSLTMCLRGP